VFRGFWDALNTRICWLTLFGSILSPYGEKYFYYLEHEEELWKNSVLRQRKSCEGGKRDHERGAGYYRLMIIAIDGLAGSGKTTAGKGLAKAVGFRFISSGQFIYRFKALEPDVDLLEAIKEHKLKIEWDVEWEGKDISAELQREEIGSKASQIALLREVREEVNNVLRFVAEGGNYVIEGRDIGTVVFSRSWSEVFPNSRRRG